LYLRVRSAILKKEYSQTFKKQTKEDTMELRIIRIIAILMILVLVFSLGASTAVLASPGTL
jgi:hypothetical protein